MLMFTIDSFYTWYKNYVVSVCDFQTRVLRNDFARYNVDEEDDVMDEEDNGWKIIHTDVFRFPACKSLFSSILGEFGGHGIALA